MKIDDFRYGLGFIIGFSVAVIASVWFTAKLMTLPPGMPAPVHVDLTMHGNTTSYSCQPLDMPKEKEKQ